MQSPTDFFKYTSKVGVQTTSTNGLTVPMARAINQWIDLSRDSNLSDAGFIQELRETLSNMPALPVAPASSNVL